MIDIHYKFHLQNKVTRTTTENGSNFVKAFVPFRSEADVLPIVPKPAEDRDDDDEDLQDVNDAEFEDVNSENVEYTHLQDALDDLSGQGHNLSVHQRCAAHTFNLVASVDADRELCNGPFKTAYRKEIQYGHPFECIS